MCDEAEIDQEAAMEKDREIGSPAQFERLPMEIISDILSALTVPRSRPNRSDFANLRLVNRGFSEVVIPYLFSEIGLWISLRSLSNLTKISEHPIISTAVRSILFSPVTFRKVNPEATQSMDGPVDAYMHATNTQDFSSTSYQICWQKNCADFKTLEPQSKAIMTQAFRRLPELNAFTISVQDTWIGAREIRESFPYLLGSELTFSGGKTLLNAMSALAAADRHLKSFGVRSRWELQPNQISFDDQQLRMPMDQYAWLTAKGLRNSFGADGMDTIRGVFDSLTELNITTITDSEDEPPELRSAVYTSLGNLLSVCSGLKRLTLYTVMIWSSCRFEKVLPKLQSNTLEYVNLQSFRVTSAETLAHFFVSNRYTLKYCYLDEVGPHHDVWTAALERMRQSKFEMLEVFQFKNCFKYGHCTDLVDFLSHRVEDWKIGDTA